MNSIPDFSQEEIQFINQTLLERYKKPIETCLAYTELRLNPLGLELIECPAVCWEVDECHFIVSKCGKSNYHNQFFYGEHEHFGTGRDFYDDLFKCVTTLLRIQADHQSQTKKT